MEQHSISTIPAKKEVSFNISDCFPLQIFVTKKIRLKFLESPNHPNTDKLFWLLKDLSTYSLPVFFGLFKKLSLSNSITF